MMRDLYFSIALCKYNSMKHNKATNKALVQYSIHNFRIKIIINILSRGLLMIQQTNKTMTS